MRRLLPFLLLPALLLPAFPARAGDPLPYPTGSTSQTYAGLRFQLVLPSDYDPGKEYSLIVILHGAGGTETGMAGALRELPPRGFVVCAPKSTGQVWSLSDLGKVKEIVRHLMEVLSIGKGRLHGAGFSNGGWNLAPLVFDEKLPFVSACWIAAGYNGGKVPKRAKKEMGALALAGSQDPNRGAAEKTVDLLRDKVRTVECRIQPGIGHEFPDKLMPYYFYWLGVMEGRFVPGECLSFDFAPSYEEFRKTMEAEKKGGFIYFYSAGDRDDPAAKALQNEAFFHPLVRWYGRQLAAVKLDRGENESLFREFKLKKTPAVVVLKKDGKVAKKLEGKIKTSAVGKAFQKVAKHKAPPKR